MLYMMDTLSDFMVEFPLFNLGTKEDPIVLLTVPHGSCAGNADPYCDIKAPIFCELLKEALQAERINVTSLVNSKTPRKTIDMNREDARGTAFRRGVTKALESFTPNSILLDIHSAPPSALDGIDFDIYTLDMDFSRDDNRFNTAIVSYLVASNIVAIRRVGTIENDIVREAIVQFGIRYVSLLEINESLGDSKIDMIASRVSRFISDFLKTRGPYL
jgi:hypothetical protein